MNLRAALQRMKYSVDFMTLTIQFKSRLSHSYVIILFIVVTTVVKRISMMLQKVWHMICSSDFLYGAFYRELKRCCLFFNFVLFRANMLVFWKGANSDQMKIVSIADIWCITFFRFTTKLIIPSRPQTLNVMILLT